MPDPHWLLYSKHEIFLEMSEGFQWVSRKITVSFVSKKILAANIPSATHFPSCVALNGAAAKHNSREASWDLSGVVILFLLLTWDLGM